MRMLSEGAEAKVFETSVFGKSAIVKMRQAKRYRIKELDETLRRTRTKREARAMYRAAEAGVSAPALLGVGKFSIYMEKLPGKLLKDVKAGRETYAKIGEMLAKMHEANIVHGDFTPANIIIHDSEPYAIDFGLADMGDSVEDKAIDLLLMKRSIGKKEYFAIQTAYSKGHGAAKQIISRLAEIEKRGRYQVRTLQ